MSELPSAQTLITHALAPGVGLTAVILYNTSLQNRFVYITGRIRELDKEARALRSEGDAGDAARLASVRTQVELMRARSRTVRRAVLLVYCAFGSLIVAVAALAGALLVAWLDRVALVAFAGAFGFVGAGAVVSAREMYLAIRTIDEDVRSTFEDG